MLEMISMNPRVLYLSSRYGGFIYNDATNRFLYYLPYTGSRASPRSRDYRTFSSFRSFMTIYRLQTIQSHRNQTIWLLCAPTIAPHAAPSAPSPTS